MIKQTIKPKKVKCLNRYCRYEWNTRSTHYRVSCPSCGSKVLTNRSKNGRE